MVGWGYCGHIPQRFDSSLNIRRPLGIKFYTTIQFLLHIVQFNLQFVRSLTIHFCGKFSFQISKRGFDLVNRQYGCALGLLSELTNLHETPLLLIKHCLIHFRLGIQP
ncbi:hypothetical protein [Bacteriophage sp.]|nr:hypothetical protein [Bacteriophage sp.]